MFCWAGSILLDDLWFPVTKMSEDVALLALVRLLPTLLLSSRFGFDVSLRVFDDYSLALYD